MCNEQSKISPQLTESQLHELADAFAKFDSERDHPMNRAELVSIIQAIGVGNSDSDMLSAMLDAAECGPEGEIDMNEFLRMVHGRMQPLDDPAEIRAVFDAIDEDHDGEVSVDELLKVLDGLGEHLTHDETLKMLQEADTNEDGLITYDEFCGMILRNK